MDTSWAYWERDGHAETGRAEAYFPFFDGKKHVISLVGGGDKSTLLAYLGQAFCRRGLRTALMTTTKIGRPQRCCLTMEECLACWAEGEAAVCGEKYAEEKFRAPASDFLQALLETADAVVVEADGAHRLACKAPAAHEPVILPQSDIVIGVMGLEVLGGRIETVCHRPERVQALLGCEGSHRLTAEDMAQILLSPQGTRKGVGEREFHIVLNKCDDAQRLENGKRILASLAARGHTQTVLTRFE